MTYRDPVKLESEPGYFFTHLMGAVTFAETMDAASLSIDPEVFES